jgi:pimeloyl-ACP methyl ester carboxylesterase
LTQQESLDEAQARRLARMLHPLYMRTDGDLAEPDAIEDVDDILRLWKALNDAFQEESGPVVISGPQRPADLPDDTGGPAAAGLPAFLDPRNIVRLTTVLLMKDRAGVVGARGVHPLLVDLLNAAPDARIHLVGHSYGCRVLLSALCAGPLPRPVRSVLLMQPALSYLAFAETLPDSGVSGGYEPAKARTELPIMVTWTRRDIPLRQLFQLAVRRSTDLGDQDIGSAGLETPPSRFAAMGGWGPEAGVGVSNETIRLPSDGAYVFGNGVEVLALESHAVIKDHSDIVRDATAWALYNLVAA